MRLAAPCGPHSQTEQPLRPPPTPAASDTPEDHSPASLVPCLTHSISTVTSRPHTAARSSRHEERTSTSAGDPIGKRATCNCSGQMTRRVRPCCWVAHRRQERHHAATRQRPTALGRCIVEAIPAGAKNPHCRLNGGTRHPSRDGIPCRLPNHA